MLTRSIYVRRVKQDENGHAVVNSEGAVEFADDEIGEVVSKDIVPVPNAEAAGGYEMRLSCTVVWQGSRYPAMTVEDVRSLAHVDDILEAFFDARAEELGYVRLDDEEEEEEATSPQAQA